MSVVKRAFAILLVFTSHFALGQTGADTLLAKDNVMIPLPTISVNFGINHPFTDVKLSAAGPSAFKQFGYQLTITQRVTKFLNASLNLYTGTIYGEQQIDSTNLNFRTTLFSQHINIEYNFYPLLKPDDNGRQLIRPYIGFGLGMLSFRSKGDLKDTKGRAYQYWADGTINAEVEGTIDAAEATQLERDLQYETDLRDANLDGLRKYPQLAFSLPINAGVRFQISKNVGVNAAFAYNLNFSDMLDNVSKDGVGNRKGSGGYDNHLYGSVGLSIFLGTTKPTAKPKRFEQQLADTETSKAEKVAEESEQAQPLADGVAEESSEESQIEEGQSPENINSETSSETTALNSVQRLDQVNNARRTVAKLQRQITVLQTNIDALGKEISATNKLKKPQIQALESLVIQQTVTNKEIETLNAQLALLDGGATQINEQPTQSQPDAVVPSSQQPKLKSKEEAIALLGKMSTELTESQTLLTEERIVLKDQELKLNQLGVVMAKIRLIEKMQSKRQGNSPVPDEELNKTVATLTEELEQLKSDSHLIALVGSTEISALLKRVQEARSGITSHKIKPEELSVSTDSKLSKQTKSSSSPTEEKKKEDGATRSVSEIENTPPKETGGFMWADVNGNGWISPDEVLHFIDLLFDGEAERTVEDIQNLIDYYFDQE